MINGTITNNQIRLATNVIETSSDVNFAKGNNIAYDTILDTGANHTCITKRVVEQTGITTTGWDIIQGVGGAIKCDNYMVRVAVSDINTKNKKYFIVQVSLLQNVNFDFDVLLGMDIIKQCRLVIEPDSRFSLEI